MRRGGLKSHIENAGEERMRREPCRGKGWIEIAD